MKIKNFTDKGFGFLVGKPDVFFHINSFRVPRLTPTGIIWEQGPDISERLKPGVEIKVIEYRANDKGKSAYAWTLPEYYVTPPMYHIYFENTPVGVTLDQELAMEYLDDHEVYEVYVAHYKDDAVYAFEPFSGSH